MYLYTQYYLPSNQYFVKVEIVWTNRFYLTILSFAVGTVYIDNRFEKVIAILSYAVENAFGQVRVGVAYKKFRCSVIITVTWTPQRSNEHYTFILFIVIRAAIYEYFRWLIVFDQEMKTDRQWRYINRVLFATLWVWNRIDFVILL